MMERKQRATASSDSKATPSIAKTDCTAKPRIRTLRACAGCCARKIKCDGQEQCSACKDSGFPCFYIPISRKRGPPKGCPARGGVRKRSAIAKEVLHKEQHSPTILSLQDEVASTRKDEKTIKFNHHLLTTSHQQEQRRGSVNSLNSSLSAPSCNSPSTSSASSSSAMPFYTHQQGDNLGQTAPYFQRHQPATLATINAHSSQLDGTLKPLPTSSDYGSNSSYDSYNRYHYNPHRRTPSLTNSWTDSPSTHSRPSMTWSPPLTSSWTSTRAPSPMHQQQNSRSPETFGSGMMPLSFESRFASPKQQQHFQHQYPNDVNDQRRPSIVLPPPIMSANRICSSSPASLACFDYKIFPAAATNTQADDHRSYRNHRLYTSF